MTGKEAPCGHSVSDYDIVVFGGPGGVAKCMVCGHEEISGGTAMHRQYIENLKAASKAKRERQGGEEVAETGEDRKREDRTDA